MNPSDEEINEPNPNAPVGIADTSHKSEMDPTDAVQFSLSQTKKLTPWRKEPSIMLLKGDLEQAKPSHDSQVNNIKRWNDLMNVEGQAKPVKVKGRSSVQPMLIRRQAEWRYPALSEPFLSSDKLFSVNPVTFEDTKPARQNQLLINWQFRTKIDRVWLIDNMVRAVVDDGTCIMKLGWKHCTRKVQKEVPVFEHYPLDTNNQQDPAVLQQVQILQQALDLKTSNPHAYEDSVPPEVQSAVDLFLEQRIPTVAKQTGTKMEMVDEVYENQPSVDLLDPANVFIDPSCQGEMNKALFIIVSFETNKAELQKDGRYVNLDQVNWDGNSPLTNPDHATTTPDSFGFKDAARKKVVAYEYWGFFDIEGDGTLKPIVATWIGDTIIRMEENPFPDQKLPFVVIPYLPVKRQIYGQPDAELLEDNQKIQGALMRGMIDLLGNSANGQKGFAKNMLDPVNRRKYENGQDYEFNPTQRPDQNIIEHKYPELPQSALMMLQLQNADSEALTGVKAFSGGLSGNAYGNVATGIRGMLDAAGKREMAILRRLAKGVCDVGRKILAMNAEFLTDTEVVRVTNSEYVPVHKDELRGEFDLMVDISTFEVDNTKAQELGFMLQTIGPNMDPRISIMILSEIADLKRMPELAETLRNWKPQPDPVQQQKAQLEVQLLQAQIAEIQSVIGLNQAKAQQATMTAGQKHLDLMEQESGAQHAREVDKIQAQSRGNQHLAITHALVKPTKEGETPPNPANAIGYTELSRQMEDQGNGR